MLETLFGEAGVLTGRSFSTYADLRASIIRFFNGQLPVSMVETSSSSTTNVLQILAENTQEGEEIKGAALRKRSLLLKSSSFEMQKGRRAKGKKANTAKKQTRQKTNSRIKVKRGKRRKAEGGRRRQHCSQDRPTEKQENWTDSSSMKGLGQRMGHWEKRINRTRNEKGRTGTTKKSVGQ